MQIDKNTAMIEYINQFEPIKSSQLFFNFGDVDDGNKQIVINSSDTNVNNQYIDGSVLKRYTFTLIDYRTITYQSVVKKAGYPNENVQEFLDVQSLIDWISEQNDSYNFPNFGEECIIDSIQALSNMPNINGVDKTIKPNIAKYSVVIQVVYLDISKRIFK